MISEVFVHKRAERLWGEAHRKHLAGDLAGAISEYRRSIELFPTPEAHTYLGWALSFQNKFQEAIEECKKAIRLDPEYGNPYNDIGSYLIQLGQLEEAMGWLELAKRAPRYEPKHFPYINLGRVFVAQGRLADALGQFERALAIKPGDPICVAAVQKLRQALR